MIVYGRVRWRTSNPDPIVPSKRKAPRKVGLAKASMKDAAIGDFNPRVTFIFGVADGNAGN